MVIQVRESGPPLADDALADLERRLGITLPAEYRAVSVGPQRRRSAARVVPSAGPRGVDRHASIGRRNEVVRLLLQQRANGRALEGLAPARPVSRHWRRFGHVGLRNALPRAVPRAAGGTRCCGRSCVFSGQRLALHRHHGRRTGPEWRVVLARRGRAEAGVLLYVWAPSLAAVCETLRPLGDSSPDWPAWSSMAISRNSAAGSNATAGTARKGRPGVDCARLRRVREALGDRQVPDGEAGRHSGDGVLRRHG